MTLCSYLLPVEKPCMHTHARNLHIHKPIIYKSYECSCSLLEDRLDMYNASLPIVVSVVG